MVMVDFFYINAMMKSGGFLLIDDIELHSVAELARLLSYQTKDFLLTADLGKLKVFEKLDRCPVARLVGNAAVCRCSERRPHRAGH